MEINNPVYSSAVGYYENNYKSNLYKNDCPVRFIEENKLIHLKNYIQQIDHIFELTTPDIWTKQFLYASSVSLYDTSFTTITINKNFRTGVHSDKGNVKDFFSILSVQSKGQYSGGYLLFPEYKIGFDIQDKDILIFNPHIKHCNSPIFETNAQKLFNSKKGLKPFLVNNKPYISGDELSAKRLSFVFYQREGLN